MATITSSSLDGVALLAPETFWTATPAQRKRVSNGCGPKGVGWMVPDWALGCCFTPACDIHDWMYEEGRTLADKEMADMVFLNNMLRIVEHRGGCLKWARLQRAHTYYVAVRDFGHLPHMRGA